MRPSEPRFLFRADERCGRRLRDGIGALLERLQKRAKAFADGDLVWDPLRVDGL